MQGQLFSMYIEATKTLSNGDRARKQWLVLPPLTKQFSEDVTPMPHVSYFHRSQERGKSRTPWKYMIDSQDLMNRDLTERLTNLERLGWKCTPPITVEIHPAELRALIADPVTPYRVLSRVERVAKVKFGIAI